MRDIVADKGPTKALGARRVLMWQVLAVLGRFEARMLTESGLGVILEFLRRMRLMVTSFKVFFHPLLLFCNHQSTDCNLLLRRAIFLLLLSIS